MEIKTIREALLWASRFLQDAGTRDPRFEAELMIRHVLQMSRASFMASLPDPISVEAMQEVESLCRRRAKHEPIQYMIGEQNFYGRDFLVAPGVLIPRPETELLVEQIMLFASRIWNQGETLDLVDIGTGSGAISLTLACEQPSWKVSTVDLSPDAIAIARQNAARLAVENRVRFLQGDLVQPLIDLGEHVDILVSNPPYIPSRDVDELDVEVREYEPRLALDGGDDGLDCYRRICAALPDVLKPTALVGFEVGIHQAQDVAELMMQSGVIDEVSIFPDLAGIDRMVIGVRHKPNS
ncbi:peptide chain release factor N(5)-glutamine methyltransferase [Brevibacillus dissolubilis]|uniref:peptide chain release factor N(5)-glutamine methyltransferase n=1 Tax=Brevibacillus dissolubilis TaxID=1844116 RepID=UPI0011164D1D|nr:peptide chain release factor N(5)-glutamine methyltransferase [Brevibacillus dissolubilis]